MNIGEILKKNAIFKSLPIDALGSLVSHLETRQFEAGEVLFNKGDPGSEMIIVQEGGIAIYMPSGDRPEIGQAIRVFQPGEMLGEMALIDGLPRSTSARAEGATTILALDVTTFLELLGEHPIMARAVMSGLSGRLRYTTDFIGEMRRWVQRMAEGDYEAIQTRQDYQDNSLASLAGDFVRMAAQVREREEKLQQEVAQLRIEIDETKRRQEVSQITGSDYYRSLKEKLKAMREDDEE
jgi:CRP-like cAMP-binding protein